MLRFLNVLFNYCTVECRTIKIIINYDLTGTAAILVTPVGVQRVPLSCTLKHLTFLSEFYFLHDIAEQS